MKVNSPILAASDPTKLNRVSATHCRAAGELLGHFGMRDHLRPRAAGPSIFGSGTRPPAVVYSLPGSSAPRPPSMADRSNGRRGSQTF